MPLVTVEDGPEPLKVTPYRENLIGCHIGNHIGENGIEMGDGIR